MSESLLQEKIFQFSVRNKRDRYKPLFCDSNFYESNLGNFWKLKTILDTKLLGPTASLERFVTYTLFLSLLRRPDDWFAGFHPNFDTSEAIPLPGLNYVTLNDIQSIAQIRIPKKLAADISLAEVVQKIRIKSIPYAALWGLQFACKNPHRFVMTSVAPSPLELLKIQSRGNRVLTFCESIENWPKFSISGRDPLSFWLHDLVHCWEYFAFPENELPQKQIYQMIEFLIHKNILPVELFTKGNSKSEELNYIISDMNSHPLHLLKTLRAVLDDADPNYWIQICDFISSKALLCINNKQIEVSQYAAMLQELSQISSASLKLVN